MLQALLYQATWRESSSNLAAFTDFPGQGQEGVWKRKTCNHLTGWTFRKMSCPDSLSSWLMQFHTPRWTVWLFILCLANVVIFTYKAFPSFLLTHGLALRTLSDILSRRSCSLSPLSHKKKKKTQLQKCTWISPLCKSPWTSLSFFP